eukprot:CAMPEP_0169154884 /NCGR_PEP_ID=MMETSP1015-20121227/53005_1 /TAXON_ID=342587 /ORGANISM="Karlodinium micrum, Strain CCMP2283" /LENGTH=93 /DNA_ID=CAMNT_0009225215 /DNA_START=437 /DNA_END=718 /DNA_ORIENTATION=+
MSVHGLSVCTIGTALVELETACPDTSDIGTTLGGDARWFAAIAAETTFTFDCNTGWSSGARAATSAATARNADMTLSQESATVQMASSGNAKR